MGSIHCITLPAGYGHSLYGVPMGPIHCITLTAMCSTHVPLLIWSANGSNTLTAMCSTHVPLLIWSANGFYTLYNFDGWLCALYMYNSLYGVPMDSIHCQSGCVINNHDYLMR